MLLSLLSVILIIPVLVMARTGLDAADHRVDAAGDITASTQHLAAILRVTPALDVEAKATSALLGSSGLPAQIALFASTIAKIDFEANMLTARDNVDGARDPLFPLGQLAALDELRARVDEDLISSAEAEEGYAGLLDALAIEADEELSTLFAAAANGDFDQGSLITAAQVADAAVSVQILQVGQSGLWARLVAPFGEPTAADVRALADNLALLGAASEELDRLAEPESIVGRAWNDEGRRSEANALSSRFEDAVGQFIEAEKPASTVEAPGDEDLGTELPPIFDPSFFQTIDPSTLASFFGNFDPGTLQTSEFDLITVLGKAVEVSESIAAEAQVIDALGTVVEAALQDVEFHAQQIETTAVAARSRTLAWMFGIVAILLIGGALLFRLVVRPIGRLEELASSVRDGDLDGHLDEQGPKELRVAARTMNEAIASLKLAEVQAAALAEGRLSDPILESSVPGSLGSSLRAAVARLTATLKEREEFQHRLAHEASHDGLTQLPNRNAVFRHLTSALARTGRGSSTMALLFIDVDGFKAFNDAHGHQVGDTVLRTTAARLKNTIREGDVAGRIGGDEFVVVAEPLDGIEDTLRLCERILDVVSQPIQAGGTTIKVSVSIGVALSDGRALTADELLRDADLAVYRAKDLGRGRVEVCDEDLRGHVVERANLEVAIAEGIGRNEFVLHYQTTVDARSSDPQSLEALVRWQRPDHGLVSPAGFIEVAERTDLILDLDRWVMSAALAQMAAWGGHETLGRLPVAVNVSGRHLSSGSLVADVTSALSQQPEVSADRLIVEITETALMDDLDQAANDLAALRRLGVKVALDDFGTGYMSLATLRNLPVDVLKIDGSFVARMQSAQERSLIELIVGTGHILGIDVTAEGVETSEQVAQLIELGSDYLQGFYFSHPCDAEALERQLDGVAAPLTQRVID